MRTLIFAISSVLALALVGGVAAAAPCKDDHPGLQVSPPANQEAKVLLRLSRAPDARATVSLVGTDGELLTVTFDPATDDAIARTVRVASGTYRIAYAGAAVSLPAERRDDAPRRRFQRACWRSDTEAKIVLAEADAAVDDADASLTLTVTVKAVPSAAAHAIDLAGGAGGADLRGFGLDDAVPAAVTETLRLIAEIAIDKAKAEAMRRFQQVVVKRVCGDLTIKAAFGSGDGLLLPATCGQLGNLRLGDLGASARGLVDALRADLSGAILTQVLAKVPTTGALDARVVALVRTLVARAATGALTGAEVRAAVVAAVRDLAANAGDDAKVLAAVVEEAARCAQQGCTADAVAARLASTLAGITGIRDQLPALAAAVARLRATLGATAAATARDQAAALVAAIAIAVETGHCTVDVCRVRVGWFRDLALGALEGDYLRALGAVSAAVRAIAADSGRSRGALALLASVLSYVDTYRATADADPAEARAQRKRALLALIEAGTDRTGRENQWVVSLGALVGFQGGYRRIHGTGDGDGAAYDLRLPLGVSALYLRDSDDAVTIFANLAIFDLANLVASSAGDDLTPELHWSDFVEINAQVGLGVGRQLPMVLAASVGWAPGLTYVDGKPDDTVARPGGRGVFRAGVVLGVHVPLFDL